jgi:hypothetical protein
VGLWGAETAAANTPIVPSTKQNRRRITNPPTPSKQPPPLNPPKTQSDTMSPSFRPVPQDLDISTPAGVKAYFPNLAQVRERVERVCMCVCFVSRAVF